MSLVDSLLATIGLAALAVLLIMIDALTRNKQ